MSTQTQLGKRKCDRCEQMRIASSFKKGAFGYTNLCAKCYGQLGGTKRTIDKIFDKANQKE